MATFPGMAQDVVWCDLCRHSPSKLFCKPCHTKLCQGCAGGHLLSRGSTSHKVVEYKLKDTEPKYPNCRTHSGKTCELHCRKCQIPVCVKCLRFSHKKHKLADISSLIESNIAKIIQDTDELETLLIPEYENEDAQTETLVSDKTMEYDALLNSIAEHGKEWHKEIDKIINKHAKNINNEKEKDLTSLERFQSEIRNTKSLIDQTIDENRNILKRMDVTEVVHYISRNHEFRQMPPRIDFTIPSFQPIKIKENELLNLFGTLSASIKSESKGFTISTAALMVSAQSLKQQLVLDRPEVQTSSFSGCRPLCRIACVGSDQAWVSGEDITITRINNHGSKPLQKLKDVCRGPWPLGLSIRNDDVLFCDYRERRVKIYRNKKIQTVVQMHDWYPQTACFSTSGDLLVFIQKGEEVKLVRYSGSVKTQTIQSDKSGKQLFTSSDYIRYMEENKNQDICVSNQDHLVVVSQSGDLRFKYHGEDVANTRNPFTPYGISTDTRCQILVADKDNNCVHILDRDGQFLCKIKNCDLVDPWCVSVDSRDRLWVGSYSTGQIKVIKYLK